MFKKKKDQGDNTDKDIELVLLRTIGNEYELSVIKSLLEDNDIPYIIRDHGIGGYMRIVAGGSWNSTDILVEKSSLELSLKLLDEFPWNIEDDENKEE